MEKVGFPRTLREADTKKERIGAEQAESRGRISSVVGRLSLTMDSCGVDPQDSVLSCHPFPRLIS